MASPSPSSSSNSSGSSASIYDPEEPVLPISPCDSPPISPDIEAAKSDTNNKKSDRRDNEDDVPSSAVQLKNQEKYLQKLNRQERAIEEVKIALKPHYLGRSIDKQQYKDVLRKAVPKICHSKKGEINPVKIHALVDAYVKKLKRREPL